MIVFSGVRSECRCWSGAASSWISPLDWPGRYQAPDGGPAPIASSFRCDRSTFKRNLREVSESALQVARITGRRPGWEKHSPAPAQPGLSNWIRVTHASSSRPGGFLETLLPVGLYRILHSLRISSSVCRACWSPKVCFLSTRDRQYPNGGLSAERGRGDLFPHRCREREDH